jgi:hypothetical protein
MFKDPLFEGEITDYDILNFHFGENGWTVSLMPNHEPPRTYIFNNVGDAPIVMWTYMKSDTRVFENFDQL